MTPPFYFDPSMRKKIFGKILYLSIMEKGFQKLLRKILLEKFPHILDVQVSHVDHPFSLRKGYEVFLVILEKDWDEMKYDSEQIEEIRNLIVNLSRYMDIEVIGIYNEIISEEEWEEYKLDQNNSI